jgi:hypothetical protein
MLGGICAGCVHVDKRVAAPGNVTVTAYICDLAVVLLIQELGEAPVTLIGQHILTSFTNP